MKILVEPLDLGHSVCDAEGGGGCGLLSPCSSYGGWILSMC